MITIRSDALTVSVNENGGAFDSVLYNETGEQLLWQGSPDSWERKDMVLFPFVCRRLDGWYTVDGKRYGIDLHGFCKDSALTAESVAEDSVTLLLADSEETRSVYPYNFELRVKYRVASTRIFVEYEVKNTGKEEMRYCVGGHFGVRLNAENGDTKGSFVRFDTPVTECVPLKGNFTDGVKKLENPLTEFETTKAFMQEHITLITLGEGRRSLTVERKGGANLRFTYDSPVISFWSTVENGEFYCVEPWWGLPDEAEKTKRELKDKPFAVTLGAGETGTLGYEIEVE